MQKSVYTLAYDSLRAALRATREAAGLTQRELAVRLKVPHSWVAKVEMGERRIDVIEACWFVAACGSKPNEVFEPVYKTALKTAQKLAKGGRGR